jgi:hypothetical protein
MAAGRLYQVAQVLGVDVGYFFEEMGRAETFRPTRQQRLLLELARTFICHPASQAPGGDRLAGARPGRARHAALSCA